MLRTSCCSDSRPKIPGEVVALIRDDVVGRWSWFVKRTLDRKVRVLDGPRAGEELPVETDLWDAALSGQREAARDVFQNFAAGVPIDAALGKYGDARNRVMRLLNGRKSCCDFKPWKGVAGRPKSSLDGVARIRPEGACGSRITLGHSAGRTARSGGAGQATRVRQRCDPVPFRVAPGCRPMDSGRMHGPSGQKEP